MGSFLFLPKNTGGVWAKQTPLFAVRVKGCFDLRDGPFILQMETLGKWLKSYVKMKKLWTDSDNPSLVEPVGSYFCDFVHVHRVIELFAKQFNNALNVQKDRQNHTNTWDGRFDTNAR